MSQDRKEGRPGGGGLRPSHLELARASGTVLEGQCAYCRRRADSGADRNAEDSPETLGYKGDGEIGQWLEGHVAARFQNSLKKWDRLLASLLIYCRIGSEGIKEIWNNTFKVFCLCSLKMFSIMNSEASLEGLMDFCL